MDGTEFQLSLERLQECIRSRDNDEIENVLSDLDSLTIEVEHSALTPSFASDVNASSRTSTESLFPSS